MRQDTEYQQASHDGRSATRPRGSRLNRHRPRQTRSQGFRNQERRPSSNHIDHDLPGESSFFNGEANLVDRRQETQGVTSQIDSTAHEGEPIAIAGPSSSGTLSNRNDSTHATHHRRGRGGRFKHSAHNMNQNRSENSSESSQRWLPHTARGHTPRNSNNQFYQDRFRQSEGIHLDENIDPRSQGNERRVSDRQSHSKQSSTNEISDMQKGISENQLKSNNFECMICCDNIHRSNPIWYCSNCYNIFHLRCATEWCNKSVRSRNEALANAQYPSLGQASNNVSVHGSQNYFETRDSQAQARNDERWNSVEWPCPACREIRHSRPSVYKCFCGKVVKPEINRHLTPHSCGQLCGRKRPNADCPHACNTVCHPGRCAPCVLTSRRSCFCGQTTKEVKCSVGPFSCNQVCGKVLLCGQHSCAKTCHSGVCGDCEQTIVISCRCGRKELEKRCNDIGKGDKSDAWSFSCDTVCGRLLDCGKHYCNEKCHVGPECPSCKLLSKNIKTCPCGSTHIKKTVLMGRGSCTDPLPTCESKCNRILICGPDKNRHRCQKRCHVGSCPPCKLKTTAHCECKLSTKTVDCALMYQRVTNGDEYYFKQVELTFTCENRCNTLKNCGRHRCYNKCCRSIKNSEAPVHRCDQVCSKKLSCMIHNCPETCHPGQCGDCTNIGWQELACHCGSSVLYPPIPCGARPPACTRPCRRPHSCGHPVTHECHDDTEKCAPCIVFVKKSCFCGSDSKDSVYCYLPGYSCGRTCKRQLACRQHACQRVCHDGDCEVPNERGAILCQQPCPVSRYLCKHPCGLPCHGVSPCPSSECRKLVEIVCECGNKKERVECHKVMRDIDNSNKLAMLSTTRRDQDTIIVDLSKKSVPQLENSSKRSPKKLDCDDSCSILKRNRALAEALDIVQPDLKPTSIFGEDPLRLLKEATAQDYKFVSSTFNSLMRFIKSAKESDKRFIFMQFPPAGKLRREVIHELAHHFNCTSESRDEEPFRHVVVRAYKNKSCVPDFSIEQLLPVTD